MPVKIVYLSDRKINSHEEPSPLRKRKKHKPGEALEVWTLHKRVRSEYISIRQKRKFKKYVKKKILTMILRNQLVKKRSVKKKT